ncbi:MAG: hypothetical protein M5U14_12900 [Acidimicrobiia bacterium]|nr:hypothetical protein [Acidimicrobiia bacterium]
MQGRNRWSRKTFAAATVAASIAAGGSAALLLTPSAGVAQEADAGGAQSDDTTGQACGRAGGGHVLSTAAEAIGIDVADLAEAVRGGQTIAEVAQANGVDPNAVVAALVAATEDRIDEAVADGKLTQEEADEKKAALTERMTDVVNGEVPLGRGGPRGHGGRGGPGRFGPHDEPDGGDDPAEGAAQDAAMLLTA